MSACILWDGARSGDGYGTVTINGKQHAAHRIAWAKANGEIPAGKWVLHKCDNPICVNPEHLFVGTPKENIQDCISKGRRNTPRGSCHANAKLTEDQVRQILVKARDTKRAELARGYGVSEALISLIVAKKIWKHVEAA